MKRFLPVNKHGFVSIYGILLLSVFSVFALYLNAQVKTMVLLEKNASLCDVCVLYHVKTHLLERQQVPENEENMQVEKDMSNSEITKQIQCYDTIVDIQFFDTKAYAHYDTFHGPVNMQIDYPEGFITQYAYE